MSIRGRRLARRERRDVARRAKAREAAPGQEPAGPAGLGDGHPGVGLRAQGAGRDHPPAEAAGVARPRPVPAAGAVRRRLPGRDHRAAHRVRRTGRLGLRAGGHRVRRSARRVHRADGLHRRRGRRGRGDSTAASSTPSWCSRPMRSTRSSAARARRSRSSTRSSTRSSRRRSRSPRDSPSRRSTRPCSERSPPRPRRPWPRSTRRRASSPSRRPRCRRPSPLATRRRWPTPPARRARRCATSGSWWPRRRASCSASAAIPTPSQATCSSRIDAAADEADAISAGGGSDISDTGCGAWRRRWRTSPRRSPRWRPLDPAVLVRPFEADTANIAPVAIEPVDYFAPSAIALLLQHLALTFAALSLVRDRELGLLELLRVGPLSSVEILVGKTIAYLAVGLAVGASLVAAAVVVLDVPLQGEVLWVAAVVVARAAGLAVAGHGPVDDLRLGDPGGAVRHAQPARRHVLLRVLPRRLAAGDPVPLHLLRPAGDLRHQLPCTT